MTVTGAAWRKPRRSAFSESEIVKDRKEGMQILRNEFGYIDGQTDVQHLLGLAGVGITVTFEEI
jgi:hypothetical protein